MDLRFERRLARPLLLEELRRHADDSLSGLALLSRPRLSVQPVSGQHWAALLAMECQPGAELGKRGKATKAGSRAIKEKCESAAAGESAGADKSDTQQQGGRKRSSSGSGGGNARGNSKPAVDGARRRQRRSS